MLEPILPTVLAVRRIPHATPELLAAFGADPARHTSLGLITCDQDDALYVALDDATKHAQVDVVFARSFYAGAAHASGVYSGEILGVLAAAEPQSIEDGIAATLRCLTHDACFYDMDGKRGVTCFPHVVTALGSYLANETGVAEGEPLAYLVAPPIEFVVGIDAAQKAAAVRVVKIMPPPSPTNFACAYLTGTQPGDLGACLAAASAFAQAIATTAVAGRMA